MYKIPLSVHPLVFEWETLLYPILKEHFFQPLIYIVWNPEPLSTVYFSRFNPNQIEFNTPTCICNQNVNIHILNSTQHENSMYRNVLVIRLRS